MTQHHVMRPVLTSAPLLVPTTLHTSSNIFHFLFKLWSMFRNQESRDKLPVNPVAGMLHTLWPITPQTTTPGQTIAQSLNCTSIFPVLDTGLKCFQHTL